MPVVFRYVYCGILVGLLSAPIQAMAAWPVISFDQNDKNNKVSSNVYDDPMFMAFWIKGSTMDKNKFKRTNDKEIIVLCLEEFRSSRSMKNGIEFDAVLQYHAQGNISVNFGYQGEFKRYIKNHVVRAAVSYVW